MGEPSTLGVEVVRNLTVALVVLLGGSVFHERVPVRLAAIHGGDWLLKIVAVTLILGIWR